MFPHCCVFQRVAVLAIGLFLNSQFSKVRYKLTQRKFSEKITLQYYTRLDFIRGIRLQNSDLNLP